MREVPFIDSAPDARRQQVIEASQREKECDSPTDPQLERRPGCERCLSWRTIGERFSHRDRKVAGQKQHRGCLPKMQDGKSDVPAVEVSQAFGSYTSRKDRARPPQGSSGRQLIELTKRYLSPAASFVVCAR